MNNDKFGWLRSLIWLTLLLGALQFAHATTVTAIVSDPNGNAYANGTVAASLVGPSGVAPSVSGTTIGSSSGPFPLDINGSFSITLTDTSTIAPSGFAWVLTVCANTTNLGPSVAPSRVCFTSAPILIIGASQNLTTVLNAAALVIGPPNDSINPIFVNVTIGGTLGVTGASTLGAVSASSYNKVVTVDGTTYPCTAAGINQANTDAIAKASVLDLSFCSGALTMTAQIALGDSAQHALRVILPTDSDAHVNQWAFNMTDGVSCGLLLYGSVTSGGQGYGNNAHLNVTRTNGSNLYADVCTRFAQTGLIADFGYFHVSGIGHYYNGATTTASGYAMILAGAYDESYFGVESFDYIASPLQVYGMCCHSRVEGTTNSFNTGGIPLTVGLAPNHNSNTTDVSFNISVGHPAVGLPNILLDNGSAIGIVRDITFDQVYGEGNTVANGTVAMVQIKQNVIGTQFVNGGTLNSETNNGGTGISCVEVEANAGGVGDVMVDRLHCTNFQSSSAVINDIKLSKTYNGVTCCGGNVNLIDHYDSDQPAFAAGIKANSINPFSGNVFTLSNLVDAQTTFNMNTGATAPQSVVQTFQDRGVSKTSLLWTSSALRLTDVTNSFSEFEFDFAANGGTSFINSGYQTAGAIRFNGTTSAGTGGVEFWSGGGSPSKVGSVDSTGKGTFNGGLITNGSQTLNAVTGNGAKIATGTGSYTSGDSVKVDATGNLVDSGAAFHAIPTFTVKKGTGAGNYSSASTTVTAVDGTNLSYTVTIPTGSKLSVVATGAVTTSTAIATATVQLYDGTCNSGTALQSTQSIPTAATNPESWALTDLITGDGASHTINLCYATSNGADSVTMINSSAPLSPRMVFELSQSQ